MSEERRESSSDSFDNFSRKNSVDCSSLSLLLSRNPIEIEPTADAPSMSLFLCSESKKCISLPEEGEPRNSSERYPSSSEKVLLVGESGSSELAQERGETGYVGKESSDLGEVGCSTGDSNPMFCRYSPFFGVPSSPEMFSLRVKFFPLKILRKGLKIIPNVFLPLSTFSANGSAL